MDQDNGHEPVNAATIDNVVRLVPKALAKLEGPKPNPATVQLLEEMLKRAIDGELQAVSMVAVTDEESVITARMSGNNSHVMTGAISLLLQRHLNHMAID